MNVSYSRFFGACVLACAGLSASAIDMNKPTGIKIGQRMTLMPYVALSAMYDSNVGARRNGGGDEDVVWTVNPSLTLDYHAENWAVQANAYYNYRDYSKSHSSMSETDQHSFGQTLRFNWANSAGSDPGWTLLVTETFRQVVQADDLNNGYYGYNNNSRQLQFGAALQHRFCENWHASLNGSYYWLDYDGGSGVSLYGWQRWVAGAELGYAASRWTDLVLAANYQGYSQDNAHGSSTYLGRAISRDSQGFTVQGGIGTHATERISYRVLAGWSRFEYGDGAMSNDGFTYTVSGNWKITDTFSTMLLGSSYYQPSEREYGTASRVDAVSWGFAKSFIRGKLTSTLDLTYRHETQEHVYRGGSDYDIDLITGRLGLNYVLNRYMSIFTYAEYIKSMNDGGSSQMHGLYDYDRWRLSLGLKFTY